jgi:hypothetical protein
VGNLKLVQSNELISADMSILRVVQSNELISANMSPPRVIQLTIQQIRKLTSLGDNWDGYGALSPSKDSILGAATLAYELFETDTPVPDVFPTPSGNIQFEWSCYQLDLEIEIVSTQKCIASFENLQSEECWEKKFTYNLTELRKVISELTAKHNAANHLQVIHG